MTPTARHSKVAIGGAIARLTACGLALILGCACAAAPPLERRVVDRAVAALGGATSIQAVTTLSIEGSGQVHDFGQSRTPDSELPIRRVEDFRRVIDFVTNRWREESIQTAGEFRTGGPDSFRFASGYADGAAFDEWNGRTQRLAKSAVKNRRSTLYHYPLGVLGAIGSGAATVVDERREGDVDAVDVVLTSGERYTLVADAESGLPARIVSMEHEPALGDVEMTTEFSDYAGVGGLSLPRRLVTKVAGVMVADIRISKTVVNGPSTALELPADVRSADPNSRRIDADEVTPGVWYLTGEGHHSVVVEFADHLTLIEAPVDDGHTLAVIAKARALRPGKPLTEVVSTHHHYDHAGGLRAAISEGLTVITHDENRRFVEQLALRPSTVIRDALARSPRSLSLQTVVDRKVLADGSRTLEIYPVTRSPHSASLLMVYLPEERLLVEADVYQPPPPSTPPRAGSPFSVRLAANLLENIEKRRLGVERVLPLHGRVVPFADLLVAAGANAR